ncbi:MAG: class I SAM-dependent methyltransferase [Pseudomonadales bacterium]|jgi:predicted methyltransferase
MRSIFIAFALLCAAMSASADNHGDFAATKEKLMAAMKSDIRTEAEVARDRNRKPVETLEFFGLRDDMTIVELVPGGGWYTKLLVPTVAEKGKYYAALGTGGIKQRLAEQPGFEAMNITGEGGRLYRPDGARFYNLDAPEDGLGVSNVDMVLTFRNYHNFGEQGRAAMNQLAFDALKSGGIYAVVDHTARHMEAPNSENRRRFDPVLAIKEIQAAGFEFVDYATLHHRLDDELVYEVGRHSVTGNTDRWTLKFRKP